MQVLPFGFGPDPAAFLQILGCSSKLQYGYSMPSLREQRPALREDLISFPQR